MIRGKLVCSDPNFGDEFKDWVTYGVQEWLREHPHEISGESYYLVNIKRSRKKGYNCTIELVGKHNLWTARYFDEDAYRAFARCLTNLFPVTENAGNVAEEVWA